MDGFLKKTGQSARDAAVKMAKQAAREPSELLGHTRAQVTGEEVHKEPLVSEIFGESANQPKPDQKKIESQERKRLQEIEAELAEMRNKRSAGEEGWKKEQEILMQKGQAVSGQKNFIEPTVRPRRGFMGGAGSPMKKGGTHEMSKPLTG